MIHYLTCQGVVEFSVEFFRCPPKGQHSGKYRGGPKEWYNDLPNGKQAKQKKIRKGFDIENKGPQMNAIGKADSNGTMIAKDYRKVIFGHFSLLRKML